MSQADNTPYNLTFRCGACDNVHEFAPLPASEIIRVMPHLLAEGCRDILIQHNADAIMRDMDQSEGAVQFFSNLNIHFGHKG